MKIDSPRCINCGEPEPRFYRGYRDNNPRCRRCHRDDLVSIGTRGVEVALAALDEEKQEYIEEYVFQLEWEHSHDFHHEIATICHELRLINAGVSPIDIKHGTWPNLEEFQIED